MVAQRSEADRLSKRNDMLDEMRKRQVKDGEGGKPTKEPPGRALCTSLEQTSASLLVQCLVTWEVLHQSLKTLVFSDVGAPLGFINLATSQDSSLI